MSKPEIKQHIELIIKGEKCVFDYRRSMFIEDRKTLIISDLHNGKTAHFRKNGIAISKLSADDDLRRLESLILNYKPEKIMILGDLSHSVKNKEWQDWINFRQTFIDLPFLLVPGNHDILDSKDYEDANIQILSDVFEDAPFSFSHDPIDDPEIGLNISGHIHPGIRLRGSARQSMTLPCFYISSNRIILPAFSSFTGRYKMKPRKGDRVLPLSSKGLFLIEN